jgi:uncharacterized protein (DUF2235 family)
MLIDTEHLHHWMQAIRQSPDPVRTMDAFWSGQLKSKEWLIETLSMNCSIKSVPYNVDIYGGWVGVLASMLFQSTIPVCKIRSIDIDPACESVATMMNKAEEIQGRFTAVTADMCDSLSEANIIINTSCEHLTQEQYNKWLLKMPTNSILVLQSNNYDIPEHVRTADSLEEFKEQSHIGVLWAGELETPMYTRYMIMGRK